MFLRRRCLRILPGFAAGLTIPTSGKNFKLKYIIILEAINEQKHRKIFYKSLSTESVSDICSFFYARAGFHIKNESC